MGHAFYELHGATYGARGEGDTRFGALLGTMETTGNRGIGVP